MRDRWQDRNPETLKRLDPITQLTGIRNFGTAQQVEYSLLARNEMPMRTSTGKHFPSTEKSHSALGGEH